MNRLPPSQLLSLLEDAVRLESRGELQAAWKRYRKVVDEDPDNAEALTLLGKAEVRLEDYHAAIFHLLRASRLAPARPDIHLALGYAWDQVGDRRNAVSSFLSAVETDRNFAPAYVSLGQIFAAKGQRDLANKAFEFARVAGSDYPEVHYQLGKFYYTQGRAEPALAALISAQRLCSQLESRNQPGSTGYYPDLDRMLGDLWLRTGEWQKACDHLERYLIAHDDDAGAWVMMSRLHVDEKNLGAAMSACERALQLDSTHAKALLQLGHLHLLRGNVPAARRSFRSALSAGAGSAAYAGLAELSMAEGEPKEALSFLKEAGDPRKFSLSTALLCARLLHAYEQTDEATRLLRYRLKHRLDLSDGRRRCHFMLGRFAEDSDDIPRAFSHYRYANKLRQQETPKFDLTLPAHVSFLDRRALGKARRAMPDIPAPVLIIGLPGEALSLLRDLLVQHPQMKRSAGSVTLATIAVELPAVLATARSYPAAVLEARGAELHELALRYRKHNSDGEDVRILLDDTSDNIDYVGLATLLFPNLRILRWHQPTAAAALEWYSGEEVGVSSAIASNLGAAGDFAEELQLKFAHWQFATDLNVLDIRAGDFLRLPRNTLQRIVAFFGLNWDATLLQLLEKGDWAERFQSAMSQQKRCDRFSRHLPNYTETLQPHKHGDSLKSG